MQIEDKYKVSEKPAGLRVKVVFQRKFNNTIIEQDHDIYNNANTTSKYNKDNSKNNINTYR